MPAQDLEIAGELKTNLIDVKSGAVKNVKDLVDPQGEGIVLCRSYVRDDAGY
jgi:hypothetical protein